MQLKINSFQLTSIFAVLFFCIFFTISSANAAPDCPGTCRSLIGGCQTNEFPIGTGIEYCPGGEGLDLCCGTKASGQPGTNQDDCAGFCVPVSQCEPGTWPAPALSDSSAKGSCKSTPNSVCCGQQIVTPTGQAPDATSTGDTQSETPKDPSIGAGCVEKTTGLIVPCVAQGSPSQVVVGIIQRVINWLLALSGTLFLVMFVWGGVQYIIWGGDSSKAAKGQKTLVNAIIGIAIVLLSYVALDYIFGSFITALGK